MQQIVPTGEKRMTERQIVVTGVAGYWGSRVAARLVTEGNFSVIGLDVEQPVEKIQGLDFIRADVRNPLMADLLKAEKVSVVCHLAFVDSTWPREASFDVNVLGTTKLLGACAEAGVHKVVLKSSTAVYGARPSNSTFLTEDHALRGSRRYGYTRDMIEIEAYCSSFRHKAPEMLLTILRFCSIVGPTVDTPMTRFLKEPWTPSLLGFDPIMQLIHEDDVVEALVHAVHNDVRGVFNVAAEDMLTLNRIRGLAGKLPFSVLHPFAYWGVRLLGGTGLHLSRYVPLELDYIRYPWVADLAKMRDELGYEPRYTAEEALREFAEQHRMAPYLSSSARLALAEERLRDIIEQRRRARERQAAVAASAEEGGDHE
jgi:UDP-glucose 4-epimerase